MVLAAQLLMRPGVAQLINGGLFEDLTVLNRGIHSVLIKGLDGNTAKSPAP